MNGFLKEIVLVQMGTQMVQPSLTALTVLFEVLGAGCTFVQLIGNLSPFDFEGTATVDLMLEEARV